MNGKRDRVAEKFLFVIWSKARRNEAGMLDAISTRFKVLRKYEVVWPKRYFTANLAAFYGWKDRFCWWNKARKCGKGSFLVIEVEDPEPNWVRDSDTSGHDLLLDANIRDVKRMLRKIDGYENRVHASQTREETTHELAALASTDASGKIQFKAINYATMENQYANSNGKVNVLCLKWGDYYGAEYVNRLYAGVKRNLSRPFRFVCVTDNAEGLRPEVDSVPFPENPDVIGRNWPNIFIKLLLFKDGFANLSGPTLFLDIDLLVTGSLDKFFDYKPGEFCIIHNWVERRKSLFRKLPDIGNSSCFRFDAGRSNGVYETFMKMKDDPAEHERFTKGSQKFQTFAMMKTGKVEWWPDKWVCSFKRQLVPLFPLNKIFVPWRPSKSVSIVAFHGQPDLPQALEGYYLKYNKPVKPHLTCKPTPWIKEYWHE